MIIQDNVLKEYLKNVYFISGTPCGGKTTISRALARKHGLTVYDMDEHFPAHQSMADPEPAPIFLHGTSEIFIRVFEIPGHGGIWELAPG